MPTPELELRSHHSFWRWQVAGWLAYGFAMFIAAAQELPLGQALVNKSVNVSLGFGLSLGLRAGYLELRRRELTLARILPVMLAGCLVAGALWSALANGFFWWYLRGDVAGLEPRHLFAWTLVHAIVLVAWCAIYLGARVVDELQRAAAVAQAAKSSANAAEPLIVRADGELIRLPQEQIHCIEAARNYSCIVSDVGTHVVRLPLSTLGAKLDAASFIRVHRSAIVSVSRLQSLRGLPTQDAIVTLTGGREIRVSRGFRAQVEQALATRS
jgi:two-component system LytT family response regulator